LCGSRLKALPILNCIIYPRSLIARMCLEQVRDRIGYP
jgi:hypothetical protein